MKPQNRRFSGRRVIGFLFALMFSSTAVAAVIAYYNPQIFMPGENDRTWITTTYFVQDHVTATSVNGINTQGAAHSQEYTMYRGGKAGLETDFGEHGEGNAEIEIEMDMAEITNVVLYTSYTDITVASAADSEQRYPILKIDGDERTQYNYSKFHGEFSVAVHPSSVSIGMEGTKRTLTLILPKSYRGEVFVQDEKGNAEINGDFALVSAEMDGGNIEIDGNISQVKVDSEFGKVQILCPYADAVEVEADTGNIYFEGAMARGYFDCEEGRLELSLTGLQEGRIEIVGGTGSVEIEVPNKDNVFFSVAKGIGSVSIFDGEEIRGHDKITYGAEHAAAKFFIGSGVGSVEIRLKK